jgi:hypothetical protein
LTFGIIWGYNADSGRMVSVCVQKNDLKEGNQLCFATNAGRKLLTAPNSVTNVVQK